MNPDNPTPAQAPEREQLAEIKMTNGSTVRLFAERWAEGRAPSLRFVRESTKGSTFSFLISPLQRHHVVAAVAAWVNACEAVGCPTSKDGQLPTSARPASTSRGGEGR